MVENMASDKLLVGLWELCDGGKYGCDVELCPVINCFFTTSSDKLLVGLCENDSDGGAEASWFRVGLGRWGALMLASGRL